MFIWLIFIAHIVIGNYLYFTKVLFVIDKSPSIRPSKQLRDIKEYLALLDIKNERPWFYSFLKNQNKISVVLVLLMLPILINIFGVFQ
jgi:hypothetical protein